MNLNDARNRFLNLCRQRRFSTLFGTLVISLYFTLFFNQHFMDAMLEGRTMDSPGDYLFMAATVLFLLALVNLLVSLFAFRYLFKPWLVLLLVTAALASYFVNSYGVIIDSNMIQNAVETDIHEATELFSWKLLFYLVVLGIIPAIIVVLTPVRYASLPRELLNKVASITVSLTVVGLVALGYYQDYASLFRNNQQMRELMVPIGYVHASYSYLKSLTPSVANELIPVGEDAKLGPAWTAGSKKVISIFVVGETARAENFSLNGYGRETNANLKKEGVIYYDNFHSCGTATAVSLPCMFSISGREQFDAIQQKHSENLLDVFKHAGLPVLWRDNNSGCKGLCDRVDSDEPDNTPENTLCHNGECYDMALMQQLQEKIDAFASGGIIVLHQKGSHGPAYFERTPRDAQLFTPLCHTNQLQQCTHSEIINAYDNTIAYTDYFLANVIKFLKLHEAEYDASLIYVSDHGESLGEGGIYLHGLPYFMAPSQQTHVPFLVWLSEGFAQRFQIDKACLATNRSQLYSHDNLFPSLLGMLNVQTTAYDSNGDLFQGCRTGRPLTSPILQTSLKG